MNSSSHDLNVSNSLRYRDSLSAAVAKNVIVLALGLTINYINGTLIHTFRKHQVFYSNPRYILFIHLVVNDMIQLTTSITLFVLTYVFSQINVAFCCLIITLVIFTTFNTPINLAVMAVECYIAICLPLQHAEFCSIERTYMALGWIWALSAVSTMSDVFIILATEPVELFYSTIQCERDNLFRHPVILKKREGSYITCLAGVLLTFLYTYFSIFFAANGAKSADRDSKKARNTILLHAFQLLLSILTYVAAVLTQALVRWFPKHYLTVIFVCYIIIHILPRFVSPIVYGLRDKMFKQYLKKYLLCIDNKPY
uniref:G-protein coupled receptors family 1 profile domain-containing protein n=1 Tax=Amphilophus citrinellus TaxID=61819 RepID=A0A3Q0RWZ5_AMPCI